MRLLVFQFSPSAFPIKYPRPKHVASVNSITVSEKRPTESTVRMFRLAPSRMIANFRIFFEVNLIPGAVAAVGFRKWLMIMPRNSAITDAPMKCSPAALSSASSPLGCRRQHQRDRHTRQIFYDLLHKTHSFFFLCLYLIAAL